MLVVLFHPWEFTGSEGGTDIYVNKLIESTKSHCEYIIICPGRVKSMSYICGVKTFKIPRLYPLSFAEIEGLKRPAAFSFFRELIELNRPDIVHFHGFGKWQVEYFKFLTAAKVKTIITPHISSLVCGKTSLITFNNTMCNGLVDVKTCGKCLLNFKYGNSLSYRIMFWLSGIVPPKRYFYHNIFLKRLLIYDNVKNTQNMLEFINQHVSSFFVLGEWFREVLILNGFNTAKIKLVKTTIKSNFVAEYKVIGPLKVLFAGRQNKEKGLFLLLNALRSLGEKEIELHLCGPIEPVSFAPIMDSIEFLKQKGYIIVQHGFIPNAAVDILLSECHLLCYPSIDAEMCPLSVLEAQAKGIPVLGADHTGIKDLIQHLNNGLLFETGKEESLISLFRFILDDHQCLLNIHDHLKLVHNQKGTDIFLEHVNFYKEVLENEN